MLVQHPSTFQPHYMAPTIPPVCAQCTGLHRYLLRLGMGEQELQTDLDFSRAGRVAAMLARRLQLLAEVEKMARQLGVNEDMAYSCETAGHFWLLHVLSRWEKFKAQVSEHGLSIAAVMMSI